MKVVNVKLIRVGRTSNGSFASNKGIARYLMAFTDQNTKVRWPQCAGSECTEENNPAYVKAIGKSFA
jgi:hypothetical protein